MSPTQLKFLLSSSAENLIRLEQILERRRELGSSPEFDAITTAMLDVCERYRNHYLTHASIINRILRDESLSQIEELGLKTLLRNCINTFFVLHELLLFLPRESIRKELHFFCRALFSEEYTTGDLSIILTSVYNAFEYSLDAAIRSLDVFMLKVPDPKKLPFGHVMELAIVDRDNPLSWGLLSHEFGHYLDHKRQISAPLAVQFVEDQLKPSKDARPNLERLFKSLAAEVFADLTAYHLVGPVSILPVVNMELNIGMTSDEPLAFDDVHPFTTTRLSIINDTATDEGMSLTVFGSYVQALNEDEEIKSKNLTDERKAEREIIKGYVAYFAGELKVKLLEELTQFKFKKFSASNLSASQELNETLKSGIPIGSKRHRTPEEIRNAIERFSSRPKAEEARATFDMLKENPVTVAEILCAGWIANSENKVTLLTEAFSGKDHQEIFPSIRKALERQDNLLMKSIEIISVMSGLDNAS